MSLNLVSHSQIPLQTAQRFRSRILFVLPSQLRVNQLLRIDAASPQKWSHSFLNTRDGPRSTKEGLDSSSLVHGILQPDSQLWRGETSEGSMASLSLIFPLRKLSLSGTSVPREGESWQKYSSRCQLLIEDRIGYHMSPLLLQHPPYLE
jgi:hypothetical protein